MEEKASQRTNVNAQQWFSTISFPYHQAIIQCSEGKLQRAAYKLHVISKTYNSNISVKKTNVTAYNVCQVMYKTVIDNQVNRYHT